MVRFRGKGLQAEAVNVGGRAEPVAMEARPLEYLRSVRPDSGESGYGGVSFYVE